MKKIRLRRLLAVCILDNLALHSITLPNVKRYITTDLLASYTIRRSTKITDQDIVVAITIAQNAIRGKPIPFRYAPRGSPTAQLRSNYILLGTADPI